MTQMTKNISRPSGFAIYLYIWWCRAERIKAELDIYVTNTAGLW